LGTPQYVTRVRLAWDKSYARVFDIQLSDDATNWTTKYHTDAGAGGKQIVNLPANSRGRYVRMYGTQRARKGGYALFDFGVDTFTRVETSYDCSNAPAWSITSLHQVQLSGTTSCLQAFAQGNVAIGSCSNREGTIDAPVPSTFVAMSNGQIQAYP